MKWLLCLIIGHKWMRYGYPSKDDDIDKDDSQLFLCKRCWAMPIVKHNGLLPRWVIPQYWKKEKK